MILGLSIPNFVLVQGLVTGLYYGLLALGLVLVYRTNRVLNFAQGQLGVVGAVFMVKCYYDFHFPYWFALIMAIGLAAGAGALSELFLRRLFNRSRVLIMVATIGLAQVLYVLTQLPFIRPKHLYQPFPVPIHLSFTIDGNIFTPGDVLTLIAAPIIALAIAAFVKFSPWGLAMRAMSENIDSARLSGVWVRRTSTITWVLAGVLSGFSAILSSPGESTSLTQVLSPDLLVLALLGALVGAMVNLTVAFIAGVGVGVLFEVLNWNLNNPATVQLYLFILLMAVLLIRIAALQKGTRTGERTAWLSGSTIVKVTDDIRLRVGKISTLTAVVIAALLPLILSVGNALIMTQICVYALIALSLTILTGWSGQVSLGQFGLVAIGADIVTHLGTSVPLVIVLPLTGAITAIVAVVIGLPALRVRGLYLAVATLAFAVFVDNALLPTSCTSLPFINRTVCLGFPDPGAENVSSPSFFGLGLSSTRIFTWFTLAILLLTIVMVRHWRDRGIGRRLIAVRDNEFAAAAAGIPVVRTKLLAFALSGFIAGFAGALFAYGTGQFDVTAFDPSLGFTVIAMVVIGGLGSINGAVLGAIYLVGLPAIFGNNSSIQFLTSGIGIVAFILYLPGGLAELLSKAIDLLASGVRWSKERNSTSFGDDLILTAATLDRLEAKGAS